MSFCMYCCLQFLSVCLSVFWKVLQRQQQKSVKSCNENAKYVSRTITPVKSTRQFGSWWLFEDLILLIMFELFTAILYLLTKLCNDIYPLPQIFCPLQQMSYMYDDFQNIKQLLAFYCNGHVPHLWYENLKKRYMIPWSSFSFV